MIHSSLNARSSPVHNSWDYWAYYNFHTDPYSDRSCSNMRDPQGAGISSVKQIFYDVGMTYERAEQGGLRHGRDYVASNTFLRHDVFVLSLTLHAANAASGVSKLVRHRMAPKTATKRKKQKAKKGLMRKYLARKLASFTAC